MAEADIVNVMDHAERVSEQPPQVDASGTTYSVPSDAVAVRAMLQSFQDTLQEIQRETRLLQELRGAGLRVNTNLSGEVLFTRYQITAQSYNVAIQIARSKMFRGDTIIRVAAGGPLYIGTHPGLYVAGLNTGEIGAVETRTVRTNSNLWAVAGVDVTFDVQEEFG